MSTIDLFYHYGFHRVLDPKGVVPQAALCVDSTPKVYHPSERLIDVKILNLDSTSMAQLARDEVDVAESIERIVKKYGKMHNPVTNSGGVLLGLCENLAMVPWASLSAIPLYLEKIKKIEGNQVEVKGQAILFGSYLFSMVPKGMDWNLVATALDLASLPIQLKRLIKTYIGSAPKVLIIGCGNAGVSAMAIVKKYRPDARVFGVDITDKNFTKIRRFGLTDNLAQLDASKPLSVLKYVNNCDFVVNCVNIENTEAASVLACRNGGTVIFFSMATRFDKASLATDATGKDVNLVIASGIAFGEDVEMFQLLKEYPGLLDITPKKEAKL